VFSFRRGSRPRTVFNRLSGTGLDGVVGLFRPDYRADRPSPLGL